MSEIMAQTLQIESATALQKGHKEERPCLVIQMPDQSLRACVKFGSGVPFWYSIKLPSI